MSVRKPHAPISGLGQETESDREPVHDLKSSEPRSNNNTNLHLLTSIHQQSWHLEFAEAVAPQLDRLQRLARRIVGSEDTAEDAVQEALTSLWREGRLPPNPTGWLSRAVVHRSLHLNRCRRRRRCHEERACTHRPENQQVGDALRTLESKELGLRIEAAVAQLPDRFREVFLLREVEQLDYEAIAETLRVPVGTVRSRLARSRAALQKALGDWVAAPDPQ